MDKDLNTTGFLPEILIVEDSPTQAAQIKHLLEGNSYHVTLSANGIKALEWLADHKPTLIVSDIIMPEMNGFEFCEKIKSDADTEDIPVILLTSMTNADEVIEGLSCGADSFITKPYNKDYLVYTIEKILLEKTVPAAKPEKLGIEINYGGKKRIIHTDPQKLVKLLLNTYQGAIHQNTELSKTQDDLRILNENLEEFVDQRTAQLVVANKELAFQNKEKEKRAAELIIANKELAFQNEEKEKRADELIIANKELAFQNKEKEKRAAELIIANKELAFQNEKKIKRAAELIIANQELEFQSKEKGKRASELIIANKELAFQNNEKEKRAGELFIANEELAFQNKEKEKRAAELVSANRKLKKNEEKILNFNAKLEERISERTAQAEAANLAKSEFLANMSHEIRTPMNAVLGFADLMGLTTIDKTQKGYIESIKSSGRSLLVLINGILDLSKIEAGKLELVLEYVNSYSFFSEFEHIFSLRFSEKGLKYVLDISADTPAGLYIDDARLRQIIINLLGNAIKFTEKGIVKIKVQTANQLINNSSGEIAEGSVDLIIEVSDTGIGIPKELQDEVFNPFVQGQGQDAKKYGGTGLGLAITKRLVQLMNGSISIKSRVNKGSAFKVTIPGVLFLTEFEKSKEEITLNPLETIFEEAVILIADDVDHNRNYLRDALKNTNLKIVEAKDGREAFSLASRIVPDLIITDIRMPVLDGFELLSKLKKDVNLKNIPVIAYSASVMKTQSEQIRKSDFAGLLIKPVSVSGLFNELKKFLPYKIHISSIPGNPLPEISQMSEINDMNGLIHSLENQFKETCATFEVIQPLGEVSDFGQQLIKLGKNHKSSIIITYGEDLVSSSESFNIESILTLINKFPGLIEKMKKFTNTQDDGNK
jgi:signal transduction histidine kinase/DNA-binding response OmpR family regulator